MNNEVVEINKSDVSITAGGVFINVDNKRIFVHRNLLHELSSEVIEEAKACLDEFVKIN